MLENKLQPHTAPEVAAMLSAAVCQFKTGDTSELGGEPYVTVRLRFDQRWVQLKQDVMDVYNHILAKQSAARVRALIVDDEPRFDLMHVVHMWASGEVHGYCVETRFRHLRAS